MSTLFRRGGAPAEAGQSLWPLVAISMLALVVAARKPVAEPAGSAGAPAARTSEASAAVDDGHGRDAKSPSDIPAKGWRDILVRTYTSINDDRVLAVAAGVTFYALLALFPAIAALVSLYGLFADPNTISSQMNQLSSVLPGGALDIIGEQVKRIASKPSGSLSFALVLSLAVSLWSANAGMKALFDALNVVYGEHEKRSFVKLNAISLLFTVSALVLIIVALGAVVVVPILLNFFGLASVGAQLIALARWPLLLVIVALALSVLYRYGPSRAKAKWQWISWGSAMAAICWLIASAGFSVYVSKFGSYNATYGSLGAAIGFMTWVWISTIVVLLGAEIASEMEHQTKADTTAGSPKPMGARGASKADTVGAER